jgi:hypothetical protein
VELSFLVVQRMHVMGMWNGAPWIHHTRPFSL